MIRKHRSKYWLILGMFFFSFFCCFCFNYIAVADKQETVINKEEFKKNDPLFLSYLDKLNFSYSEFERSLNKFLVDLDKINRREIDQQYIDYKNPRLKLEELKRATQELKDKLPPNSYQDVDGITQVIEEKFEKIFNKLDNKINVQHLSDVQKIMKIEGNLDTTKQLNLLINYLTKQNEELNNYFKNLNKTFNPSPIQVEVILMILLIIWLLFLVSIIIKDKKTTQLYNQNNQNIEESIQNIEESIQDIGELINLPNNENEVNKELENIKKNIEQIIEINQNQNIPLLLPRKEINQKLIPQETERKPSKKDIFIPLYEEMVSRYNQNPNFYPNTAIIVSRKIEQNYGRETKPRLSRQDNGMCWLIEIKNIAYLFPRKNLILNEHNFPYLEELFVCFGYQPEFSKRFQLLKPALVRQAEDEWELLENGVLQFESGEYS